jgi:hypothetical protein
MFFIDTEEARGVRLACRSAPLTKGIPSAPGDSDCYRRLGEIDSVLNVTMPTENELNITNTKPIEDPSTGPFVPHLNWNRAM